MIEVKMDILAWHKKLLELGYCSNPPSIKPGGITCDIVERRGVTIPVATEFSPDPVQTIINFHKKRIEIMEYEIKHASKKFFSLENEIATSKTKIQALK